VEAGLPLKDVPILGGAIAGHATHLLTGDERDFGKLWGKTIQGVKILSPRMLVEELQLK
jgi:predicted nucleic acid-binding protein